MEQLSLFAPVGASEPSARVRVLASLLDKLNKGLNKGLDEGPDEGLYLGTSSWSFPGWAGIVYDSKVSQTTLARHGLAAYARHPLFRTVCIDRTYYSPITAEDFARYESAVPEDFRFVVKAHELVTSARQKDDFASPNPLFLEPGYAVDEVIGPLFFRYVAVQYAERANHLGVGIREEWIAKPSHPLGEMREDFGRVVANRSDTKTLGFEFIGSIFQLHELGFAIRSPIGRAVKQKDRAVRTFQSIEIPSFAVLIDRTEIRNAGTDLEAGLLVVIIASIGSKTSCARSGAAKIVIKSQPKILHCRITRASIAIVDAERGRQLCSTLQRESSLWCQELEIVSLSLASSKSSC